MRLPQSQHKAKDWLPPRINYRTSRRSSKSTSPHSSIRPHPPDVRQIHSLLRSRPPTRSEKQIGLPTPLLPLSAKYSTHATESCLRLCVPLSPVVAITQQIIRLATSIPAGRLTRCLGR